METSHQLARNRYQQWLEKVQDADLLQQLKQIEGQEDEIYERFYRELSFGTAGLRGLIGAGTNRMNRYTVRATTQGLADYLNAQYSKASVAIAYDSRILSDIFAQEAACVLAANGITAHLFSELMPTPTLSFAVRHLQCQAGIVITASHNPSAYNGYKCYGADGCQMTEEAAEQVTACIAHVDLFDGVKTVDYQIALEQQTVRLIPEEVIEQYLACVQQQQVLPNICKQVPLHVIYTPLHGAGNKPVRTILDRIGVNKVTVVAKQELPDGNFPTAPYPNPEIRQAFECALQLAETQQADLLIATDPDSDRMGAAVRDGDGYTLLTGNEIGCLLLEYILSVRKQQGKLPADSVMIKSIVTSDLACRIAEAYGCQTIETLTGFKYIGEQIGLLESKGEQRRYQFGFEESYGYLAGSYVRDKDGVVAAMLLCETAAYCKQQGMTLLQKLDHLYCKYGAYRHAVVNRQFEGAQGMLHMQHLMASLREKMPTLIAGIAVVGCDDYLRRIRVTADGTVLDSLELPASDVLSFHLQNGASVIIRPSGTEPKIKAYITAVAEDVAKANDLLKRLQQQAVSLLT